MIFRGSQVLMVLAFFVALILVGTIGYELIEGWNWADAFYMTIITITAVGYHEVHPLTETGRYWTVFMLIGGITGLGMWFALVTASMLRMDLRNTYKRRKIMKRLGRIKDHVIVCGGGSMGRQLMQELEGAKKQCVLIERYPEAVEALQKINPDVLVIEDNATEDRVLTEAGIDRAMGLVTCLSGDTDNLFVCLSARHLNPKLVIIGRAEGDDSTAKMYRAGADHVVSPNMTGALWVASLLVRPSAASFLDVTSSGLGLSRHINQVTIDAASGMAGLTLSDARIHKETGLLVIAIRKGGHAPDETIFNPNAATRLEAGDDLIVLGNDEQIRQLRAHIS